MSGAGGSRAVSKDLSELQALTSMKWHKEPSPGVWSLGRRGCTKTELVVLGFLAEKAAVQNPGAEPGTTRVLSNVWELRCAAGASERSIEYAIAGIGPPKEVTDPKRRKQLLEKTGHTTVGKNFVEAKFDPRSGQWEFRLLVENWQEPDPTKPGGLERKRPRRRKALTASHDGPLRMAAFTQEIAPPQFSACDPPHFFAGEAQLLAWGCRFDPITGDLLGQRASGGEPQRIAAASITGKPPAQRTEEENPQRIAAAPPYLRERSGEEPQMAAARFPAPREGLRAPAQPVAEIDANDCAPPIRERLYGREEEKLASPPQLIAAAQLAQLLAGNGIEVPDEGTRRNLLDRNKYKGPGLPGPREVTTFIVLNRDRSSWRDPVTGQLKWGVVMTSVREDMMPSLRAQGWPPPEDLAEAEELSRKGREVMPGIEKALESRNRTLAILRASRNKSNE